MFAIIDESDFDLVSKYKWLAHQHKKGATWYAKTFAGTRPNMNVLSMHQLILDRVLVDHKNGDGLDNRRSNLRLCTPSQNCQNKTKQKTKTSSKYKGVHWNKNMSKWHVQIEKNGVGIYLGCFKDEIEAAKVYDKKAIELFGEFARLNFNDKAPSYQSA